MQKILNTFLFLVVFATVVAHATPTDSTASDTTVINVEHKNPLFVRIVSWPFVRIVQPAAEFLMYPVIPPLIYVSRENLIERGHNLITYGENRQIMFYPIANAKVGGGSNIGFAYRHEDLFLKNDVLFFSPHLYINADWDISFRYRKKNIMGSQFFAEMNTSYREIGTRAFRDPEITTYYFADSSTYVSPAVGYNLTKNWSLKYTQGLNFYRFNLPVLDEEVRDDNASLDRGFYQHFESYPLTLSLHYGSLDVPYAATRGYKMDFGYTYVPVSQYNNSKDHNFHVLESRVMKYTLLGNKSYAMTVAESNANRERLKNLSFKEAMELFNPVNVKEEVLDRRVLITQLKARYMIEENEGKAPFTAMGSLGDNFPLRAYPSGHFTAPLVAGVSMEYRWPIDIYADALIFNEYGIYSHDFKDIALSNLRNSYGLGFRVRTPKLFIMRFALAFHGLHGVSLILTTRPEYD